MPAPALPRALELGAALGVEKVILATDDETVEQVQAKLANGTAQFWSATQHGKFIGVMITELVQRATGMVLFIPYMAGERPMEWVPAMADMIGPMAREVGCEAVETNTREGMRKFLISQGWRKTFIRMRVDL